MRILHAPVNIAGQPYVLSRALRRLGHSSDVLVRERHAFGYPHDVVFNYDHLRSPFRQLRTGARLVDLIRRYDVFHFYFGDSLLAAHRDLPILRAAGRRIVFHFRGCDIRMRERERATRQVCACRDCPAPCATDLVKRELRDLALTMADHVLVSTPDLLEWVPGSELVGQAIELADYPMPELREPTGKKLVVLHAPSSPLIKGTAYLASAVARLQAAGYPIELRMMEGRPHAEVLEAIDEADIVVDQLLAGWYGNFALEAMARARPVVAYVRDDLQRIAGVSPPVFSATPETIQDVLARLIDDPMLRMQLASEGRPYVERVHSAEHVAQKLLVYYGRSSARKHRAS